jgi:hypothetical protein
MHTALEEGDDTPADNFICPACARDLVKGACPVHGEQRRFGSRPANTPQRQEA